MNQQLNRFSLTVEEVYKIKTSPNLIVIGQIDSGQINVNEEIYCYRSTADKKYMRVTEIKRKGLSVAWAQSGDKIIICLEGSNLTKEDVHNGDILFKRQKWDEKQKVEETVELLVVAPMSSGKSTVINAILGMNILPSSNFACTAHKYKITINDKNEQVEVSVRVRNGKMEKVTDVNGETLKKINEDEISKEINIEAPSYGRLAQTRKIVLIDTPGANYSGNSSHRAVTDSIISEFSGNAVLYILNASQIGTEDDEKILKKIKGLLDKNKDMEIIFALNKADVINRDKAIEYYKKAAEKGNRHAEYKMFETFFDRGEREKAFELLNKSANAGNLESQNMMGNCKAFEHFGMEVNEEEGAKWYRKAAEQGYAEAQCNLAFCYKLGIGVEENEEEAYKWYRKAAEQGYADAQCDVGDCYKDGIGVEVDFYQTIEWYTKALEQGEARAQYFIGYCYEMGDGMEENKAMAYNLYQKAAEQGYADAQYRLGLCYEHGRGTEIDGEEAYEYYKMAADAIIPVPMACMKIANAYYSQIDSGLDAIGRTGAMVAASVLIPITSLITIPAALLGSSAVRASKKKKFLDTEAGKDMMKYYYIAADRGNEEAKEKIEELSQYL